MIFDEKEWQSCWYYGVLKIIMMTLKLTFANTFFMSTTLDSYDTLF